MKYFTYLTIIIIVASALAFAKPTITSDPDTNVVALWHFDEGTGAVLSDSSPYHNDGIIHNADWVTGESGTALHFDGATSYVDLSNSPSLQIDSGFTIEAWISLDTLQFPTNAYGSSPVILGNLGPYPFGGGYQLDLTENAEIRFSYRCGVPTSEFSNTYPLTQTHHFYHIAAVYERVDPLTTIKLYVDGLMVDSSVFAEPIQYNETDMFYLGTNRDGRAVDGPGIREFPGIIDEVQITKIARQNNELALNRLTPLPSKLDFGFVKSGETKTGHVTLFNTSDTGTITITNIAGTNSKFTISGSPAPVAPHDSIQFDITYAPTSPGFDTGSIHFSLSNADIPETDVQLLGKSYTGDMDTNVVAYWHFDEGADTILHDASFYGNNGIIHNGEWVTGESGTGLHFDGSTSYVEVPNTSSLELNKEFTIEAWLSLDTLLFGQPNSVYGTTPVLLGNLGPYPYGGGYQIDLTEDAGLRFSYRSGTPISEFSHTYPITSTHRFYHVASVYQRVDSTTIIKLYVNGLLVDSSVFAEPIHYTACDKFYLGTNRDGKAVGSIGIRELPGIIDEVKISKIAKQPADFSIASLVPVPSEVNYNFVPVGETKTGHVTLFNTSATATIGIDSIVVTNNNFSITGSAVPVAPQTSAGFDISYSPTSTGIDKGTIRFYLSNASVPETDVQLIGKAYSGDYDTNVVAWWHFDEGSGTMLHDASLYQNNGTIHNADWVTGQSGTALHFNGFSSFVDLANSPSLQLDSQFTIEAWVSFDSLHFAPMAPPHAPSPVILGNLGTYPYGGGYQLDLDQDAGLRFSYRCGTPVSEFSRTYTIPSAHQFYHVASVYQRIDSKTIIKLYLDATLVDSSVFDEPIQYTSTDKFYIGTNIDGRAAGSFGVRELPGILDEVRISRVARNPNEFGVNQILASSSTVDFGTVILGDTATQQVTITNTSYTTTVTVNVSGTSNPEITADQTSFTLSPRAQQVVTLTYVPADSISDTSHFTFTPTDATISPVSVTVTGASHALLESPVITAIKDVPNDNGGQVTMTWFQSKYEKPSAPLHVAEYSVWRNVEDLTPSGIPGIVEGQVVNVGERKITLLNGALWEFITTVPAANLKQYSFVAPTTHNSTAHVTHVSTFRVNAHVTTGGDFFSAPLSGASIDNIVPSAPRSLSTAIVSDHITINWNAASDNDVKSYNIYRSTQSDFPPQHTSQIGNSSTTEYTDLTVSAAKQYYYAITSVDASDNESRDAVTSTGITLTTIGNTEFNISDRWNLISVPVLVPDFTSSAVFPTATSRAFGYRNGYNNADTLNPGTGYWMKFTNNQSIHLHGYSIPNATIPVIKGWNLIGSISSSIPVASITSNPPGIVTSQFFAYTSAYATSATVDPGRGYWVKANQNGALVLSSSNINGSFNCIRIVPTNELPPTPPKSAENRKPTVFALEQNYPNPFNPTTTLRYQLPVDGNVTLRIYNLLGQEVQTLVDGFQNAGYKEVQFNGASLSSGVYFYRLEAGKYSDVKKMMLIK